MLDQMISSIQADNGQVRFVVYAVVSETDAREIARKLRYSGVAQFEDISRQFEVAARVLEAERLGHAIFTDIEQPPPTKRNPSEAPKEAEL